MMNFNINLHMVTVSPWPLFYSINLFNLMMSSLMYLNNFNMYFIFFNLFLMMFISYQWWRDVVRESTFQGFHIPLVFNSLQIGMILFIISELLFFISFFWSYFSLMLDQNVDLGLHFPPSGILMFNPFNIPLLNTLILLSSGISLTYSHYNLLQNKNFCSLFFLLLTIVLGVYFTFLQFIEYYDSFFMMSDSFYGGVVFMSTGFHGFHVCVGTIFLLVMFCRMLSNHFSDYHHFGFEASIWYWHFVDLIWLFLYLFYYWWSN